MSFTFVSLIIHYNVHIVSMGVFLMPFIKKRMDQRNNQNDAGGPSKIKLFIENQIIARIPKY